MTELLETLEKRLFLSATSPQLGADANAIANDGVVMQANAKAGAKLLATDVAAIKTDFKRLKLKGAAAAGSTKLNSDVSKFSALLKKDAAGLFAKGKSDLAKVVTADKAAVKKPADAKLRGKVVAALAKLSAAAATASKLITDANAAQTTLSADLTAVALASNDATLQAHVSKFNGDVLTVKTELADIAVKIQTDVAQLVTDYNA